MKELAILLVEDEALVQDLIREALEDAGYRVIAVATGEDAIGVLCGGENISGLVTDVNLGRGQLNGWDVARRAREERHDVPIVYVSGDSAHDWAARGVPHSVMVPKPFATTQIIVALAEMLNARTTDL